MDQIKAFVGHSFLERDKLLVDKVLAFLEGIREVHPNFSWEHAQHPEAIGVDEKVLTRFEGKTLFIGICTRSERAVDAEDLKPGWINKQNLTAASSAFKWKTSDWIIQEIGLAVGRKMEVILLLENHTRPPGALQGNREYIPLDRDAPERSFPALLAMIGSLTPKGAAAEAAPAKSPATESVPAAEPETEEPGSNWETPTPAWTVREYERAFFFAVSFGDQQDESRIRKAFFEADISGSELARRRFESHVEYTKIALQRGGNLARIKELAEKEPPVASVWSNLAGCYELYGEHAGAVAAYERAVELETDPVAKIWRLGKAALSAHRAGDASKARELLASVRGVADGSEEREAEALVAEEDFAKETRDDELFFGAAERLLEIDPGNTGRRFRLAFRYSELKMHDLAALHYERIPRPDRDQFTWNNIGYALSEIGVPGRSVDAYRESEEAGGTLAMANLANALIDAGFFKEAGELLERAAAKADHHVSVDAALATLKQAPEREDKKRGEVNLKANRVSEFYKHFGAALAEPDAKQIPDTWEGPDGPLRLRMTGEGVVLEGTYEADMYAGFLSAALMGPAAVISTPPRQRYRITYSGAVRGRTVSGTVTRTKEGERAPPATLLGEANTPTVLMWIASDQSRMSVLERSPSGDPRWYDLRPSLT